MAPADGPPALRPETRAPDADTQEPVPLAQPVMGESDLVTSYLTLEQLIAERGMPPGSLDELVVGMPTSCR